MSTVNSKKLSKKLLHQYICRCKFWVVCGQKNCDHYEPHHISTRKCVLHNPVKWCRNAEGFVYCVPLNEIDSNYECDPNLAFKAKRDAEEHSYHGKYR